MKLYEGAVFLIVGLALVGAAIGGTSIYYNEKIRSIKLAYGATIVSTSSSNVRLEWSLESCEGLLERDAPEAYFGIYQVMR
ncbi:hypothetical protein LCGC14_2665270 [marine sediment metagenome]|uniref:Uncharacterized protein n=1 Tax=marine sediment metagenome TaxID=412755 RepID=A0A0F9CHL3_9ZZZZ